MCYLNELYIILGVSVIVSAIFIYLTYQLRTQDGELQTFINDTIEEMQQLDLSNPTALKEFMNRKMGEIDDDTEFHDQFSEVMDDDTTTND